MKKRLLSVVITMSLAVTMLAGCGSKAASEPAQAAPAATEEKAEEAAPAAEAAEEAPAAAEADASAAGKKVGFVTFGLGGDFFQQLAEEYEKEFTNAGYEAMYADGQFNPTAQIEAAENYIAMGVDVLVCWSVAPEAMGEIVAKCQEKGIKFVAFVAPTEEFDAVMISDNAELADNLNKLAAKWIDEKYADAEDHSVPVVVLSSREAETGVVQADELIKIEEFSKKAKFVKEVECTAESVEAGASATENLYAKDTDTRVILTAHANLGTGADSVISAINSPVKDYINEIGVFAINGDPTMAENILSDESALRGMVLTGSPNDTALDMLDVVNGVLDGTYEKGYVQKAGTLFVTDATAEEYITTGHVTTLSEADFQ